MAPTSRLLIDEPPLVVLPSLVRALGGHDAACFAQQVHYVATGPRGVIRDGHRWASMTVAQWCDEVVLTPKQCRRIIGILADMHVIVRHAAPGFDRTACTRVDYAVLDTLCHRPGTADPSRPNGTDGTGLFGPDDPLTESTGEEPTPPVAARTAGQRANAMMRRMVDGITRATGTAPVSIRPPAMVKLLTPFMERYEDEPVRQALLALWNDGAPITAATLEAQLQGRRRARGAPRPAGPTVADRLAGLQYDEHGNLVAQ